MKEKDFYLKELAQLDAEILKNICELAKNKNIHQWFKGAQFILLKLKLKDYL